MSTPFPHHDPTSPLFGSTPAVTGPAMTDVIVGPSTNTEKPWRYLIGYAHTYGFDNHIVEREQPLHTEADIRAFIADMARERRHNQAALISLVQMAGPQPLVFRVPVNDGPDADTNPYRYLITYYGTNTSGRGYAMANFITSFDVQIKGPAHISLLEDVCADASKFDPRKTHIINYTLLAGPAL